MPGPQGFADVGVLGQRQKTAGPGQAPLLQNPELRFALRWRAARKPNPAWAQAYSRAEDDFEVAMRYLDRSRQRKAMDWALRTALVGLFVGILLPVATALLVWGSSWSRSFKTTLYVVLGSLLALPLVRMELYWSVHGVNLLTFVGLFLVIRLRRPRKRA